MQFSVAIYVRLVATHTYSINKYPINGSVIYIKCHRYFVVERLISTLRITTLAGCIILPSAEAAAQIRACSARAT